ncbi:MAG: hypothetical protein PHO18_07510, partial [Synergistaceae bacterium]|nr:hypothetical protein [Synergistaceae bacterium]
MVEKISLNGEWQFRQYGNRCKSLACNGWNPAQVPGTVHQDLLCLDAIQNPFYRLNEKEVAWVAECDWAYQRKFYLPQDFNTDAPAELIFHGLDTYAEIVLNGHSLGKSENMFIPWRRRVEEYLKPGHNLLEVHFASPMKKTSEIAANEGLPFQNGGGIPERGYARKALYSFGWDWGP